MAKKPAFSAKDWEKLVNDGTNYGDEGEGFTPKQKALFECIKDKKVLKVQDAYAFSKHGKKEENHAIELAELIAGFEPVDKVKSFIITHNGLTPQALQVLIDSKYVQDIEYLQFGSNELGDEGVQMIANSEKFCNVHTLNLECNGIGPEGAKALATSPFLSNIDYLSLVDNRIGEEGAYAIADSDNLASLTYLHLGGNRIKSDAAKEALRQSKKLVNLQTLKIF